MRNGHNLFERITEQFTASDAAPHQTIIEIVEDKRVLIENHQGVIAYGREKIIVKVLFGHVCICGKQLELMQITKDHLVILGRIEAVTMQRRD